MSEKESKASIAATSNSHLFAAKLFFAGLVLFVVGAVILFCSEKSILGYSDFSRENLKSMVQNMNLHLPVLESRDGKSSILDMTVVQVAIGIGVFAVLNIVAITGHHIVQKVRRSTSLYRSIEHVESPF